MDLIDTLSELSIIKIKREANEWTTLTFDETLNINKQSTVEDFEEGCKLRWPNAEYEHDLLIKYLKKDDLTWEEHYHTMELIQKKWVAAESLNKVCYEFAHKSEPTSGKRKALNDLRGVQTVTAVAVNEFWGVILARESEESKQFICFTEILELDGDENVSINWKRTDVEIEGQFSVGFLYFNELYIATKQALMVFELPEMKLLGKVVLENVDKNSVNAIRVSNLLVVLSIASLGFVVYRRWANLPVVAYHANKDITTLALFQNHIAIGTKIGTVEKWHVNINDNSEFTLVRDETLEPMHERQTKSGKTLALVPGPIFNIVFHGPHLIITTQCDCISLNYETQVECVLNKKWPTTANIYKFGEFVFFRMFDKRIYQMEFLSGMVNTRDDNAPKIFELIDKLKDVKITIGAQHMSFSFGKVVALLPDGAIYTVAPF